MASLGHLMVGAALGRWSEARVTPPSAPWRAMVGFSAMSMLPDLDVIAFRFGLPYSHAFGHRGATHSLLFAGLVGLVAWALTKRGRTAAFIALTVATHPLLDMLTDGGLGVALFFPFSLERLFWPWQPLPVAPIGVGMLSARGLFVVGVEALVFAPLAVFALWPRPRSR